MPIIQIHDLKIQELMPIALKYLRLGKFARCQNKNKTIVFINVHLISFIFGIIKQQDSDFYILNLN